MAWITKHTWQCDRCYAGAERQPQIEHRASLQGDALTGPGTGAGFSWADMCEPCNATVREIVVLAFEAAKEQRLADGTDGLQPSLFSGGFVTTPTKPDDIGIPWPPGKGSPPPAVTQMVVRADDFTPEQFFVGARGGTEPPRRT